ncbi:MULTISPECIES: hypothetical protein [Sorangium]|uniref:Uncharacterized protein n=1 Tax=Sorangium cellulosum (strain So ce56) TaxID=448385 RepID=A9G2F8_SORC5|nr:hypothetical protein [Sorangium cellulosum]CAN95645.1 hypothetical protein predicted by Glimmer/Critica [Sorangium cellulosum So ce56]
MADPYIDPFETKIYGKFAREQMAAVLMGKVAALDGMVEFAMGKQLLADQAMSDVLDRQPRPAPELDTAEVLDEARDVIVRFGSYLDSLKGRPVDPRLFFRGEMPSVLARRRITKLTAAVGHIADELERQREKVRGADVWLTELREVHEKLGVVERQQRATRVERIELGPEVSTAREAWLGVYNANKSLVRGLLAHLGKPELLPHIFDDLAEVHRATGVSDALPPGQPAAPDAPSAQPGASPDA